MMGLLNRVVAICNSGLKRVKDFVTKNKQETARFIGWLVIEVIKAIIEMLTRLHI